MADNRIISISGVFMNVLITEVFSVVFHKKNVAKMSVLRIK